MRLEIGAGEHPQPSYNLHTDLLPLRGIDIVCRLDALPFTDSSVTAMRANHVLEHQSYELIEMTLREWARVLAPGAELDIGVPDALHIAKQWIQGAIDTPEANYWLLGGHSDRSAHKGVDEQGTPRWIWNAHHTLFDSTWLGELLEACGFEDVDISCYDIRNLRCISRRGPGA
ncbi:MAG: methyltransferase domain-containing protein [Actinobacteria bacterium]|nr:methyltransferase domain-containing protein [Actinomycetota bacterium]